MTPAATLDADVLFRTFDPKGTPTVASAQNNELLGGVCKIGKRQRNDVEAAAGPQAGRQCGEHLRIGQDDQARRHDDREYRTRIVRRKRSQDGRRQSRRSNWRSWSSEYFCCKRRGL